MTFRIPLSSFVDQTARDAAAAAQTTANNALQVAGARNHVFVQSTEPTTDTAALTLDDLWIDPSNGNRISSWDGSAWQPVALGTDAFAAGSITTDLLAAGAVAAGNLAADAINGRTITGGRYYTAPTTTGAGVSMFQGTDTANHPKGKIIFADGRIGIGPPGTDQPGAALTFVLSYDAAGNPVGSTFALAGDSISGATAPELDLNVESDGAGGYVGVTRLSGDQVIVSARGAALALGDLVTVTSASAVATTGSAEQHLGSGSPNVTSVALRTGRAYEAVYAGKISAGNVAGNVTVRIRAATAGATPTTSSPMAAAAQAYLAVAGGPGQESVETAGQSFQITADGNYTFHCFAATGAASGTAAIAPLDTGIHALTIRDVGPANAGTRTLL